MTIIQGILPEMLWVPETEDESDIIGEKAIINKPRKKKGKTYISDLSRHPE